MQNGWLVRVVVLILIALSNFSSTAQFKETYRGSDSTNQITGMSFLNASTGYVAFAKFIGFTQDGGKTYTKREVYIGNTDYNGYPVGLTLGFFPEGVHAFSTDSLLAYGHFSFEPSILFSANGGQTWKLIFHKNINLNASTYSDGITDLEFPGNGAIGYAIHHEQILKTINRGQSWSQVFSAPGQILRKLSCPSANIIYASGGNRMYKSADAGSSWTSIAPSAASAANYKNIDFRSEQTGYCSENTARQVYKTINGGQLWTKMNDESIVPISCDDMKAVNDSTIFMAGNLYEVLKSTDNGQTWEYCKKDKSYQYKLYGMNALFFLNEQNGWAGGWGEYLLSTTNGGAITIPAAYFKVDISSVNTNNVVYLNNYSKTGYNYKWYKNSTLISSDYNASYTRTLNVVRDSITLVVSNGIDSDTMIQYAEFGPPMTITSFSPEVGMPDGQIRIHGNNFSNITSVTFGGVPASSILNLSSTDIIAVVGKNGNSGDIKIFNSTTSASKSGFVFLKDPKTDMGLAIDDSILCKSESLRVTVDNTEADVLYELKNAANKSFGSAKGNGGQLQFASLPLAVSGNYYISASRSYLNVSNTKKLPRNINVKVEHPHSVFYADQVNIAIGEAVKFTSYSQETDYYSWTFRDGANISTSNESSKGNIIYSSAGPKVVSLISKTIDGCKDTLTKEAVVVYNKPATEDVCYVNNTDHESSYYFPGALKDMSGTIDDGYIICGFGVNALIKSRYGTSQKLNSAETGHLANYTKDGILKWINYLPGGQINAAVADKDGNIYIAGYCHSDKFYHFSNGDSMTLIPANAANHPGYDKDNGFVMKLDANGNYIWHTLIIDHSQLWQGYQVQGGNSYRIRLKNNRLIILGSALANLSYYNKGVLTQMIAVTNANDPNYNQNDYILQIDTSGAFKWSSYAHNNATNQLGEFKDVNIDVAGNVYVTGTCEYETDIVDHFDKKIKIAGPVANVVGYLLKYDAQGNLLWNVHFEAGAAGPYGVGGDASMTAFAFGPAGDIYVTGRADCHDNRQDFIVNDAAGTKTTLSYGGIFIMKITPAGKYEWMQGCTYSYYGGGDAMYFDGNNFVIAGSAGHWQQEWGMFTFTSVSGEVQNIRIESTAFLLVKYSLEGRLVSIQPSSTTHAGITNINRIFGDSKNNLLLGGHHSRFVDQPQPYEIFGIQVTSDIQGLFYEKLNPAFCVMNDFNYPYAGNDIAVCSGEPVTLGTANTQGRNYTWSSKPEGFSSTSHSVIVNPRVTTTYYSALLNNSGIVTYDSVIVSVKTVAVDAGPDKWICTGNSAAIGGANIGNEFSWSSLPTGFSSNIANPLVTPEENTRYILAVKDYEGCVGTDTVSVSFSLPSVNAGDDKLVCRGANIAIGNRDIKNTYSWISIPAGFVSSVATPVINAAENMQYVVELTDSVGCKVTDTVSVSVKDVPAKPAIFKDEDGTLRSSSVYGNQWYIDTTKAIPYVNSDIYKPAVEGLYSVRVTLDGCSSEFSDRYNYKIPAIDDPSEDDDSLSENPVIIFPNPVRQSVRITFDIPGVNQLSVEIYDNRGRRIILQQHVKSGDLIDVLNLSTGIHIIRLVDENNQVRATKQIFKL